MWVENEGKVFIEIPHFNLSAIFLCCDIGMTVFLFNYFGQVVLEVLKGLKKIDLRFASIYHQSISGLFAEALA